MLRSGSAGTGGGVDLCDEGSFGVKHQHTHRTIAIRALKGDRILRGAAGGERESKELMAVGGIERKVFHNDRLDQPAELHRMTHGVIRLENIRGIVGINGQFGDGSIRVVLRGCLIDIGEQPDEYRPMHIGRQRDRVTAGPGLTRQKCGYGDAPLNERSIAKADGILVIPDERCGSCKGYSGAYVGDGNHHREGLAGDDSIRIQLHIGNERGPGCGGSGERHRIIRTCHRAAGDGQEIAPGGQLIQGDRSRAVASRRVNAQHVAHLVLDHRVDAGYGAVEGK